MTIQTHEEKAAHLAYIQTGIASEILRLNEFALRDEIAKALATEYKRGINSATGCALPSEDDFIQYVSDTFVPSYEIPMRMAYRWLNGRMAFGKTIIEP